MRAPALFLVLGLACASCATPTELPDVAETHQADFPLTPRRACDPRLLAAVKTADVAVIRALAAARVPMSCGDLEQGGPLDHAVMDDRVEVVRALLEGGADPNMRWSTHGDRWPLNSAIVAAAHNGPRAHRAEIVSLLIRHGADVNGRWCEFESRGNPGSALGCVANGAPTALISAAYRGQADTVTLLLDAGAGPRATDREGGIALDYAPDETLYGLLLMRTFRSEEEAIRDFVTRVPPPYGRGRDGGTPLQRAIRQRLYGRARLLVAAGADPNQRTTTFGDVTPLADAISFSSGAFVRMLLEHGADPNARSCFMVYREPGRPGSLEGCTVDRGITPLMQAQFDPVGLGELLISAGADPSARDWRGRSVDDYAREAGRR